MRIQIALDLTDLLKAVNMARDLCTAGADLLEAGTPFIKTFGIGAVALLKSSCPSAELVADLKTADVGALEAELARTAGADWATVMAATNIETIEEFALRGRELGLKIALDTIGVLSPYDRVKEVLGRVPLDMAIMHLGIDVQKRRGLTVDQLVAEALRVKDLGVSVAVAGGIGQRELEKIATTNIDVAIIGRAITSAPSPKEAFLLLKSIITK
ncbi:MAG: orotidine 5'-phosphate decarboxylase [Thermoproteus sp.]|jgi:3-hexulose-6-phosphate synthase|nr:orotidine 5'-phosphate decarboxylase [Thermoproteus sp.]